MAEAIYGNAWIYDNIQCLCGLRETKYRLAVHLAEMHRKIILDIGAGTGTYRELIPETAQYLWIDTDANKLHRFLKKHGASWAAYSDATRICLRDDSVDFALCVAVSHHLSDEELSRMLSELARVVREKLIFVDALDCPDLLLSQFLWKYDYGSFPRSAWKLLSAVEKEFEVEESEEYRVYHRYLLCTAKPKTVREWTVQVKR